MDEPEHETRFTRERLTDLLRALSDVLKERGQRGALYIVTPEPDVGRPPNRIRRAGAAGYRYSPAPGPTGSPSSIQTTSISDQQARKTTV